MILLGNIFLGLAALVFWALFNMMFLKTPPRGGDAVVGYAWALIFGVLAFSICLSIVTAVIGKLGGFAWSEGNAKTAMVVTGLLLVLLGNGFFTLMAGEGTSDLPPFVRQVFRYIPAVLPPLLILAAGLLLNAGPKGVPALSYQLPIALGLLTGIAAIALMLVQHSRQTAARTKAKTEYQDQFQIDRLRQIDTTDLSTNIVFLFVFTDANQAPIVRERALARIKMRPDWQEELVRRLQNDWAPEAFNFLASNEVDNKDLFPEAVREGILIQARLIRESIRKCRGDYDLYQGRYSWEVERVLRTIDRFQGMGVDYRPAVVELRKALDEPTSFKKPKLYCVPVLDKWLKKH